MQNVIYSIKQAWASLAAKPGFVGAVVVTMGLTLGALLCVITLAYLLLVAPLPYPQSDQLFTVEHNLIDKDGGIDGTAFTYPNLLHLYNQQNTFSELALLYHDADVLLSSVSHPTLPISFITPEWFSLLGADYALGRGFEQTEALNTYHPVAVLSYATWQSEFALDKDILSKTVQFGTTSYRVVGVLSQTFVEPQIFGVGNKSQVFLPWDFNSVSDSERKKWGNDDGGLKAIGRLKSGMTSQQAGQQLTSLVNENWQQQVSGRAFFGGWGISIKIHTLESVILANGKNTVYLLLAAVLGLVLIACTNIANLFMSRTVERSRQIAICAALGASRRQIFNTFLTEAALLMLLSTWLALYVASIGFSGMQLFLSHYLPRIDELSLHVSTFAGAVLVMVTLALFFAKISMGMIRYQALYQSMQQSGKGAGIQVAKELRQGLVFCQIAVVAVLVFINIVLFNEAMSNINQSSGFATKDRSFVVLSLPALEPEQRPKLVEFMSQVRNELQALPQVEQVSQSMAPMPFRTLAMSRLGGEERYSLQGKDVDQHYFQLIQQPLLAGNYFSQEDINDQNNVVIVNEVFANQLVLDGNAIGLTFDNGARIVGIVKGTMLPGESTVEPRFYYTASPARNMFLLKTKTNTTLTREQIVEVLKTVSNQLKLFSLSTLESRRVERLFGQYATAVTSGVLAIVTFLLAAIGLYGILSYSTQIRRFEIGTHLAIGAKRQDIVWLVLKDNAAMLLLGLLTSVVTVLGLYAALHEHAQAYLNGDLVVPILLTLLSISLLCGFACYWPLRQYINQPVIYSLQVRD